MFVSAQKKKSVDQMKYFIGRLAFYLYPEKKKPFDMTFSKN